MQPAILWLLFELGQGGAGVAVEEVFPMLAVGIACAGAGPNCTQNAHSRTVRASIWRWLGVG